MANNESIVIDEMTVPRGTRQAGSIRALELPDGSWVEYPVVVVAGAKPGPRLYIGAGIHGDEVVSVGIAQKAVQAIDPQQLSGEVVCLPIQNPLAFRDQFRLPLGTIVKSPMDQLHPGDAWAAFPGDANGNSAQRMAARLFDVIRNADAVIDIHTPTTGGRYVSFIFLPPPTSKAYTASHELAKAFAPDFILQADQGVYVQESTLHTAAANLGIPGFGFEVGEGGRLEDDLVDKGVQGVFNAMHHLGMLPDEPVKVNTRTVSSMTAVRCNRAGLLRTVVELGTEVTEGQLLATITNQYGDIVEEIHAPHAGPFMRSTTLPIVMAGERVAQIGVEV